jgi:two-component system response regulator YesN
MLKETLSPSPAYNYIMRFKISELLSRVSEECRQESNMDTTIPDIVMVRHVTDFIKANYSKKLTYDYLASTAYVSKSKLFSTFKEVTGQNVGKYIEIVRLERACELLTRTRSPIGDIMVTVGYHDMKMFCKRFKEFTKMTPSEYRKSGGTAVEDDE